VVKIAGDNFLTAGALLDFTGPADLDAWMAAHG
jgi:hypothetical protein